jgi:hypothetical protein
MAELTAALAIAKMVLSIIGAILVIRKNWPKRRR